jgi:hypothetical protein
MLRNLQDKAWAGVEVHFDFGLSYIPGHQETGASDPLSKW